MQNIFQFKSLQIIISVILFASLTGCSFSSKTTKRLLDESKNESYDMIVVPGVPLEDGKWSRVMKARIYWAKYLYEKGIAKNIMFSGSAVYSPYVEAEIMSLYAQALGIPKENIYVESKAEHSTENIYYSYNKALKLGFKTVALASDPFQTRMLKKFSRSNVSEDVKLIPIVIDTLRMIEPEMIDPVIDIRSAYVENFVSLPERENFFERLRGTMGLKLEAPSN